MYFTPAYLFCESNVEGKEYSEKEALFELESNENPYDLPDYEDKWKEDLDSSRKLIIKLIEEI